MSRLKPDEAKSTYHWRSRYYPYHWWRRRYYPYYWWRRRWYTQPAETAPQDLSQPQPGAQNSNVAAALQQAFCLRLDTMFMVKALQYARDKSPTDEDIYNLVDDMLEMYHAEWEMLDEDDFEELVPTESTAQESTPENPLPPPPMPEPSPAPTANAPCPTPEPEPEPEQPPAAA